MIDLLLHSFGAMMMPAPLLLIVVGTVLGVVIGAIPGLNGAMLVALSLPLTYGWTTPNAIALLVGEYVGSISGGLISACLLNIPGSPSNIMTILDGAPLAAKGFPERALALGIFSSFIGGLFSWVALVLLSPPLAKLALAFGPHEYFAMILVALMLIASLSQGSFVKGLIAAILGMLAAVPGLDSITAQLRLDFGFPQMSAGFDVLSVLIGVFAVTQLLADAVPERVDAVRIKLTGASVMLRFSDLRRHGWNLLRSSVIGTWIGILPGIGGSVGSIVAYASAKNLSRTPELFGTGHEAGIVASETANNATIGGALVPLLTMGIPGSIIDVFLIAALILHDLQPGPLLFVNSPEIAYGFMSSMFISNVVMLLVMLGSIRWLARVIEVPKAYLLPVLLMFCVVGTFAVNNRLFDVWVMLAFGLVGLLFRALQIPAAPFIVGFILMPMAERNLRTALITSDGKLASFLGHPVAVGLILVAVAVLIWPFMPKRRHVPA